MNRFDRITSLLILLQSRTVITAKFLAEHFNVTERTIYRDIRSLENAGVPIGSETGVGYFLDRGYHLPPISFSLDEAAALLLGEKLLSSSLDQSSLQDFKQALNKIRAVIDRSDKDYLSAFDANIEVFPTGSHFPIDDTLSQNRSTHDIANNQPDTKIKQQDATTSSNKWLRECRSALVLRKIVEIDYNALSNQQSIRRIEPIGLFYYSWHWHLIAWCQLRAGYRDFRLDRIQSFKTKSEQFERRNRLTLKQYLTERPEREKLQEVEVLFSFEAARFVGEQRYMFGYVDQEQQDNGIKMRFLTPMAGYMARWLLQYTNQVTVIKGDYIKKALQQLSLELSVHWK
jgi:predicted DNA-binding transcriptional regulator YafY